MVEKVCMGFTLGVIGEVSQPVKSRIVLESTRNAASQVGYITYIAHLSLHWFMYLIPWEMSSVCMSMCSCAQTL